jgi:hypothetical protein
MNRMVRADESPLVVLMLSPLRSLADYGLLEAPLLDYSTKSPQGYSCTFARLSPTRGSRSREVRAELALLR